MTLWIALILICIYNVYLAIGLGQWNPRYMLILFPIIFFLICDELQKLSVNKFGTAVLSILLLLISCFSTYHGVRPILVEQYREAAAYIHQDVSRNANIVYVWEPNVVAYNYYLQLNFAGGMKSYDLMPYSATPDLSKVCSFLKNSKEDPYLFYWNGYEKYAKSIIANCGNGNHSYEKQSFIGVSVVKFVTLK